MGCRNRVRIPANVNLDKQSSPFSPSSTLQPQSDAMGLGTISFHPKRREFCYVCGDGSAKGGGSYAQVYPYVSMVLTIEPSSTLLLRQK